MITSDDTSIDAVGRWRWKDIYVYIYMYSFSEGRCRKVKVSEAIFVDKILRVKDRGYFYCLKELVLSSWARFLERKERKEGRCRKQMKAGVFVGRSGLSIPGNLL